MRVPFSRPSRAHLLRHMLLARNRGFSVLRTFTPGYLPSPFQGGVPGPGVDEDWQLRVAHARSFSRCWRHRSR